MVMKWLWPVIIAASLICSRVMAETVNIGNVYPVGAVPVSNSITGSTSAVAATLPASQWLHTYICGFSIRANAAGAQTNNSTLSGIAGGPMNFTQWTAPAASGIGLTEEIFSPCLMSSAINTAIVVTGGAAGSGGVESVAAWGFQLP